MDHALTEALDRGETTRQIAATMYLTEDSIKWRIKQLGRSLRDGWHSRQEVAVALGVSYRSVNRWMRTGLLAVTKHGTRWTRVTDTDLRAFVEHYAGLEFDADGVNDPSLRRLAETNSTVNRRRAWRTSPDAS